MTFLSKLSHILQLRHQTCYALRLYRVKTPSKDNQSSRSLNSQNQYWYQPQKLSIIQIPADEARASVGFLRSPVDKMDCGAGSHIYCDYRQSASGVQTKNKDTGIGVEEVFPNNTREFKAKRVAEQISHIPGSPA